MPVALRKESVDRNTFACYTIDNERRSLSARRAWIEMRVAAGSGVFYAVALRKESVDRNIRREMSLMRPYAVALRKESVDRNMGASYGRTAKMVSLSARRAWIEIDHHKRRLRDGLVALRKESVDRNAQNPPGDIHRPPSLSARRAWIEILVPCWVLYSSSRCRSPQGERG